MSSLKMNPIATGLLIAGLASNFGAASSFAQTREKLNTIFEHTATAFPDELAVTKDAPAPSAPRDKFAAGTEETQYLAEGDRGSSFSSFNELTIAELKQTRKRFSSILSGGQSYLVPPAKVGVVEVKSLGAHEDVLMVRVPSTDTDRISASISALISGDDVTESAAPLAGDVGALSIPVAIPADKTYEAREFDQYLADVRTVSEIPGTGDVVVIRRVPKGKINSYLADFDRMEGQRIVAGWISKKGGSSVKRPPLYEDRTAINPATGRKYGPEKVFEEIYAPLVKLGLVSQSDFRLLDRDFHDSLDTQLRKKEEPELLSSKFRPNSNQMSA